MIDEKTRKLLGSIIGRAQALHMMAPPETQPIVATLITEIGCLIVNKMKLATVEELRKWAREYLDGAFGTLAGILKKKLEDPNIELEEEVRQQFSDYIEELEGKSTKSTNAEDSLNQFWAT